MKKGKVFLGYGAALVSICCIVFGVAKMFQAFQVTAPYHFAASTKLSERELSGVKLHDTTASDRLKNYGGFRRVNRDRSRYEQRLWHAGLVTASIKSGRDKGKIIELMIIADSQEAGIALPPYSSPFRTARGIKIGNTEKQVKKKYGKNYYTYTDAAHDKVVGYVDHNARIKLDFIFDQNGLIKIIRLADQNI